MPSQMLGCCSQDSTRVLKRDEIDPNDLLVFIFYVGAKYSECSSLACPFADQKDLDRHLHHLHVSRKK